ncbi:MAG: ROK family protein [Acidobacteria bacterium]|nr:ROK family protein [Acidobacteriota bacterium]
MRLEQASSLIVKPKVAPPLDPGFQPACLSNQEFRRLTASSGGVPLRLAFERADGSVSTFSTTVLPPGAPNFPLNFRYIERIVKFLLWQRGGWKIYVGGPVEIGKHIRTAYAAGGAREFDAVFMGGVYEHPFTVVVTDPDKVPAEKEVTLPPGRNLDGCRVGFDLGASDRKASALVNGQVVYSEEVPWDPRNASDPTYHYEGIMDSIRRAASKLPRLDAVGGSAAGIYINNRARVASLFRGVSKRDFEDKIAGMFLRIRDDLGVPLEVVNDGEVTALAGSMSLGENPVLGTALGSSQAAGYVDSAGNITGWLNELAFAPVDYRLDAPADEWSGDIGCGVQYFSQVGAIRVAEGADMRFEPGLALPEKLVALQDKMRAGDPLARQVYETIGAYLGYGIAHYSDFYRLKHILILGRVSTGPGGEIIVSAAKAVLQEEFPELAGRINLALPDESSRRVGQSIAAASLPRIHRERA